MKYVKAPYPFNMIFDMMEHMSGHGIPEEISDLLFNKFNENTSSEDVVKLGIELEKDIEEYLAWEEKNNKNVDTNKTRKLIDMRYVNHMTYIDISCKLNVSKTTPSDSIHRILRRFTWHKPVIAYKLAAFIAEDITDKPVLLFQMRIFEKYGYLPYLSDVFPFLRTKNTVQGAITKFNKDPRNLTIAKVGIVEYVTSNEMRIADLETQVKLLKGRLGETVDEKTNQPIVILTDSLPISVRAFNALKRAGINDTRMMMDLSVEEWTKIRNLGYNTYQEIKDTLSVYGLEIPDISRDDFTKLNALKYKY